MPVKQAISTRILPLALEWEQRVGKTNFTKLCLNHDADINDGINPYSIRSIISSNNLELLQRILGQQKLSTDNLHTALEIAVTNGHCKIAKYLLENHPLPTQDNLDITLIKAVLYKEHNAAALLIKYGADKEAGRAELSEAKTTWSPIDITAMTQILDTIEPDPILMIDGHTTNIEPEIFTA